MVAAGCLAPPSAWSQNYQEAQIAYQYDCTKLAYASAGCDSYNQMIKSNDSDVISSLKTSTDAYVCFVEDEDEFFIVSFTEPEDSEYSSSPTTRSLLQSSGAFSYSKYKDGVQNDLGFLFGKWSKVKGLSTSATYLAKDSAGQSHAAVTENEVSYDNTFKNLNDTTTTFALQIRRSTLRFNETYTFPQPATPSRKTGTTAPHSQSQDQITQNGRCVEFK